MSDSVMLNLCESIVSVITMLGWRSTKLHIAAGILTPENDHCEWLIIHWEMGQVDSYLEAWEHSYNQIQWGNVEITFRKQKLLLSIFLYIGSLA